MDVAPSPKLQAYVASVPSGSAEPPAVKFTTNGRAPLWTDAFATAVGDWFATTTTVLVPVEVAPASSVTTSWTV